MDSMASSVSSDGRFLVFSRDQSEHDARLMAVLERIESAGATLNPDKCEFGKSTLKFLGHLIDEKGIQADPDKTAAIQEMSPPSNVPELRRFMGMVNQMGKFTPNLADLTQPLRELLHTDLGQYYFRRLSQPGSQWHLHHDQCPTQKVDMHKLKR